MGIAVGGRNRVACQAGLARKIYGGDPIKIFYAIIIGWTQVLYSSQKQFGTRFLARNLTQIYVFAPPPPNNNKFIYLKQKRTINYNIN